MAGKPSWPAFATLPFIFLLLHTGFRPTKAAPSQFRADGDFNARLRDVSVGSNSLRAQPLQTMQNIPSSPVAAVRSQNALAAIRKQVTSGGSFVDLHTLVGTALDVKSKNPNATVTFSLPASALPESIGRGTPYYEPGSFSLFSASAEGDEGPDPLAQSLSAAAPTVLVNTSTGTFYKAGIQNDTLELMRLLIQLMQQHPGSSVTVTLRDTGTPSPDESPLQVAVRLDAAFSSEYATPVISWDGSDGVASGPKSTLLSKSHSPDHGPGDTRPTNVSAMTVPSGLPPPPASLPPAVEVNLEAPLLTSPSAALPPMPSSSEIPTLAPSWAPAPSQSPGGSSGPRLEPASIASSLAHSTASPAGLLSQPFALPANLSFKVISRGQQPPPSLPRRPPVSHHASQDADISPSMPPVYCSPTSRPVALQWPQGLIAVAPTSPSSIDVSPAYVSSLPVPRSSPSLYDFTPPKSLEANSATTYNGRYLPSPTPPTQPTNPPSYPYERSLPSPWPLSLDSQTLSQSFPGHSAATMQNPTMRHSQHPGSVPAPNISQPPVQPIFLPTYRPIELAAQPSPRPWRPQPDKPPVYADVPPSASQQASPSPSYISQLPTEHEEPQPSWSLPTRPIMQSPASYGSQPSLALPPGPAAYPSMPLAPSPWASLPAPSKPASAPVYTDSHASPPPCQLASYGSQPSLALPPGPAAYPSMPLAPSPWASLPAPSKPASAPVYTDSHASPPPCQLASYGSQPSLALPAGPAAYPSMPLAPSPWASSPAPSKPASAPVYTDSPTQSPKQQLPVSYPTNRRPESPMRFLGSPTQSTNLQVVTASLLQATQQPPLYALPSGLMDHSRQLPASPQPTHLARRQPEGQIVIQSSAPGYPSWPPPYGVQPPPQPLHQPAHPQSLPLPSYPAPPAQQPGNARVYSNILPSPALGQQAASPSKVLPASNFPIRQPSTYTSSTPLQHRLSQPADRHVSYAEPPSYSSSQFGPSRQPPSYALSASQLPMQSGTVELAISPLPPRDVPEELQPSSSEPTATLPSNGAVELQSLNPGLPQNVPPPSPVAEALPQLVRLDPLPVTPGAASGPESPGKTSLGSPQLPSIPLPSLKPPSLAPPYPPTPSSARDMQLEQVRSQIQAMLDFILASNGGRSQLNISRMPADAAPTSRSVYLVAGEMKPAQQSPSPPLSNVQKQIVAQGVAGGPRRMMLHRRAYRG